MLWRPHFQFSLGGIASSRCRGVIVDYAGNVIVVGDTDGDMAALSGAKKSVSDAQAQEQVVDIMPHNVLHWKSGHLYARSSFDLTTVLERLSILRLYATP